MTSPQLWLVATPLGNSGDLSPRAKLTLESVDLILAEDTRRAQDLCQRCGVQAHKFSPLHEHNEAEKIPWILSELQHKSLALISDAGMPVLADPGFHLVRACRQAKIPVSVIPGPSAPLCALAGSGLPPMPYTFLGFLPRNQSDIANTFLPFAQIQTTIIFFERKNRLADSLQTAYSILGQREVCIARELTKTYEEFIYLQLSETPPENLLGEITVVIGPPQPSPKTSPAEVHALMQNTPSKSPKQLAKIIQTQVNGWTSKEIYALMLENKAD